MPDKQTSDFYDDYSEDKSREYESADVSVTHSLLIKYWELARDAYTDRFDMEAGRSLIRGMVDSRNWKAPLFSGLVENVETLAMQRGLRKWESRQ